MLIGAILCRLGCHHIPSWGQGHAMGLEHGDRITCSRCGDVFEFLNSYGVSGWHNVSAASRSSGVQETKRRAELDRQSRGRAQWNVDRKRERPR